jgi:hypothetical protein
MQVLKEPGKAAPSTSYMWVYRSACRRRMNNPRTFLAGYKGLLMTDGYAAWRTLDGPTHFGYQAHARRAFVDALMSIGLWSPRHGSPTAKHCARSLALPRVTRLSHSRINLSTRQQLRSSRCQRAGY